MSYPACGTDVDRLLGANPYPNEHSCRLGRGLAPQRWVSSIGEGVRFLRLFRKDKPTLTE